MKPSQINFAKTFQITDREPCGWFEVKIGDIVIGMFPTEEMANEFARSLNDGRYDKFLSPISNS